MSREFSHNHYVPKWYQRRFLPLGRGKFHYLDLSPETVPNAGHPYTRHAVRRLGPPSCFAENDLYTTRWGAVENFDIEKFFFGDLDTRGKRAVEFFGDFEIRAGLQEAHRDFLEYLSVQKMRTPKGLEYLTGLADLAGKQVGYQAGRNEALMMLQRIKHMYCALWVEAVWQIADASQSSTKFIISDHPVTVYNRRCFPGSRYCKGSNDPDIRMAGSHTYFPLSLDKILIFTNLTWVRNPYQNARRFRPHSDFFHQTIAKLTDVQIGRELTEQEVLEINYITKKSALRYVAAAEKEWLYPEDKLPSTHWSKFGHGYLLMPEPRLVHMGGEIFVGYEDGRSEAWDEYGRRPWQPGYSDPNRSKRESSALQKFQDEYAKLFGPVWKSTTPDWGADRRIEDPPEIIEHRKRRAQRRTRA